MSTFAEILRELSKPFSTKAIQWRPGATNKARTRAQALAYVDVRHYMERLDAVAPDWQSEVQPLGNGQVLVRLTVAGVTRTDVGEADPQDANTLTSAFAQAFKRACAQFGLGRYLYHIPKMWCDYDADRKVLLETPVLPEWAVPEEERSAYFAAFGGQRKVPVGNGQATAQANGNGAKARANGNGNGAQPQAGGEIRIHFGKNKGKALTEVDEGWLRWYANSAKPRNAQDERLLEAVKAELARREAAQAAPQPEPEPKPQEPAPSPEEPDPEPDPYDEIPF